MFEWLRATGAFPPPFHVLTCQIELHKTSHSNDKVGAFSHQFMDSCAVFQLELFTFGLSNSLRAKIRVSVEHCVYKDQEKGVWSEAKLGQSGRNITSTPFLTRVNHTFKSHSPWSWMLGIPQAMAQRGISLWTLRNGLLNLHCARGKTQRDVINPI